MNPNKIKEELERLLELVGGWASEGGIPSIERDLALDKLKSLYEAVRFAGVSERPAGPAAEPGNPSEEAPVPDEEEPVVEVFDLDDVVSAPVHSVPEEEFAVPESPAPAAETTEPLAESEPAAEIMPEPGIEDSAAAVPAAESPEEKAVPESGAEPAMRTSGKEEPAAEKEKEEAPCLQNSLFDMSEIPVHRRDSRRVLMSLYGDAPVRKPLSGLHAKPAVSAAAPKPEAGEKPKEAPESKTEPVPAPAPEAAPTVEEEPAFSEEPRRTEVCPEPADESAAAEPAVPEPMTEEPEDPENEADEEAVFSEEPVVTELPDKTSAQEPRPVLGEVFHADRPTLGETLVPPAGAAPTLGAAAIGSLREAIGINDRFLLIGDLFGGDRERYEEAIERLDAQESLDDCMIHIAENYTWNPNSDGAKLLFELLERKYGEC